MIAPGQKLRPRRRTHRTNKEPIKPRPIPRQRINVRRGQIGIAIQTEIPPTLIVGEDDHDIGLFSLNSKLKEKNKKKNDFLHAQFSRSAGIAERNFY